MRITILLIIGLSIVGCEPTEDKLKIYGRKEISDNGDTIYHKIADYQFIDQDSSLVTPRTFEDKVYVADFFFTSCPTICPKMKAEMLRVYDKFEATPDFKILSHTLDPEHDTVAVLNRFANDLGVSSEKWHFVTGEKEEIYKHGQTSYMVTAMEDPTAPGGFLHSGAFLLIDKERRVRGIYDGTIPEEVDKLMVDIDKLLAEYEN